MKEGNSKNEITASKENFLLFHQAGQKLQKSYKKQPLHVMNFIMLLKKILKVLVYGK